MNIRILAFVFILGNFFITAQARDWKTPIYDGVVSGSIEQVPSCALNILRETDKNLMYEVRSLDTGAKELEGSIQGFYRFLITFTASNEQLNVSALDMSDSPSQFLKSALEAIKTCSQ